MENLNELKGLIKRVLEERGVKLASSNQYKDIFTLNGTLNYENYGKHYNPFKKEWVEDIKIKDITLDVSETNRSNGTKANVSYYITIRKYEKNVSTPLGSVKVSYKDSSKKQLKLINEIVDQYLEAIK